MKTRGKSTWMRLVNRFLICSDEMWSYNTLRKGPFAEKIESLKTAILSSRPPYCAGTLSLQPEELIIFYGKMDPESTGRIDFNDVNDERLQHLSETCDKATFGLNQEDVLDESYRKAGKLDSSCFSTKIDLERSGLMTIVRYNLLEGSASRRPIKAELYKLNVYGKDSFFKAHKDTPRGTTMFGSLVIVFPTPHEGGALILRHNHKEWTFDSANEIGRTKNIGYIAFFSDVEHEVATVRSGYRITITYNLYYDFEALFKILEPTKALPMNECAVKNSLQALIEDEKFYPNGTHLGFGLNHAYPIELKPWGTSTLDFIAQYLKGSDAVLMKACKELGLDGKLYVFYTDENERGKYEVIVPRVVELDGDYTMEEDETFVDYLKGEDGAKVIGYTPYKSVEEQSSGEEDDEVVDFQVTWITEKTSFNETRASWMAVSWTGRASNHYLRPFDRDVACKKIKS
ncbi:hypothetical protein ACEPAF_9446 [Sanghuangporus sanghuang]